MAGVDDNQEDNQENQIQEPEQESASVRTAAERSGSSASPGAFLAEKREAAGLSRARIATELGLTETVVREIEDNEFDKFPAGIYVRGYLRNYSKILGFEEQELMDIYDQYCHEQGLLQPARRSERTPMDPEDRQKIFISVIIGLLVVVGAGILIWLVNI